MHVFILLSAASNKSLIRRIIVPPMIADQRRIFVHDDFEVIFPVFCPQIHIGNDPQSAGNLVGQILQQLFAALNADCLSIVILADEKGAAVGICIVAQPFQVIIPPGFFPFDFLMYKHDGCLQLVCPSVLNCYQQFRYFLCFNSVLPYFYLLFDSHFMINIFQTREEW